MKKIKKAFALLLSTAFLFGGVVGCNNNAGDSGENPGTSGPEVKPDEPSTPEDTSGITVPAPSFEGVYFPAANADNAYEDSVLLIKFDSAPTVDRSGSGTVKIYDGETLVDTVKPADETLSSNAKNPTYQLINVKDQLIAVNGNVVAVKLHKSLENGKRYTVKIDSGLITGKINGSDFAGIADDSWSFTTRSAPSISGTTITVGSDKNFSTVLGALEYLKDKTGNWTVEIDEGYYHEFLSYSGSANVNLVGMQEGFDARSGEDGKVVIYWANANLWNPSTRQRASFLWEGGDLTVKNLTIANNISRSDIGKDGTQAEALYYDAVGKIVAYNASFKSHQDTLLIGNNGGRGWFYKCYIEGDTDFIWGYPETVLFEECQIRCLYDPAPAVTTHTSYIFASRSVHTAESNKGLVLFNCNIKVDDGVTAYYGRNSGSDTQAAVVFNTFEKIDSALWFEGSTKYDEDIEGVCAIGYKDFGNTYKDGSEIPTDGRKEGAYGLSKEVAEREYCGRNAILNRGWNASLRKYEPVASQWDLSALETEFNASPDKSKKMIYLEPTYIPYLEGNAASEAFAAKDYAGKNVENLTYKTNDATLAEVSDAGVVTAKENQNGIVTITASSGELSGVARVKIIPQIVVATALAFDKTEAFEIFKDDVITLNAIFTPENVTDSEIIWSSSDSNILRVEGEGATGTGTSAKVTGFGVGKATITATSKKTPSVTASIDITVNKAFNVKYLSEGVYTKKATVAYRDATIVANPVTYGFAGDVEVVPPSAEIMWGNNGWPFASAGAVSGNSGDIAWADFTIKALADIKLTGLSSSMYCSATSNLRGIAYVKVGDGEFVNKGEVKAESKAMKFTKQDITTEVKAGETATVRVAIALLDGKTVNKALTGVIGDVSIYYEVTGTPVAFPGADGTYNITDYYTGNGSQWDSVENGSSADGMVSWDSLVYHSANYGVAVSGSGSTGYVNIKVGGPSVISIVGSQYGNGTLTVTDSSEKIIAGPVSTKMTSDSAIATRTLSFLYTGSAEDNLKLAFTGTSYIGTITVKELTNEVAEVKSVTVNGAETVSTAAPSQFTATVETTYCASGDVVWSSSDESVAKVNETGKVTGLKAGTATITATSVVDSSKTGTFDITVIEEELKPVAGTTYTYNFKDSSASDYVAVTAKVEGASPDSFVSWNGNWNTHSYGLASTTGAALSIKVAGSVVVGFTGYNAANGVMKVTDAAGNTVLERMPTATGSDATTKWFIYKGEETTLTLTNTTGTTYITTLTVKPWTNEVPVVTGVSLSGASSVAIGQTITLSAKVTEEYFADTSVIWESNDSSIAIVDENGVVTGVAAGEVTITATSKATSAVSGSKTIKVTSGESNPIYGYTYSYGLTGGVGSPYVSADGFLKITANSDNGGHGLVMKDGNTIVLKVAGAGTISLIRCKYDKSATITLTNSAGTVIETKEALAATANDGDATDFTYSGAADTLTLTYSTGTGGHYLHGVKFTPASNSVTYTLTGGVGTPFTSDDGNLKVTANGDNGGHGLIMKDGNTVVLKVAGAGTISLIRCKYDNSATITLTNSEGTVIETKEALAATANDGDATDFTYSGAADTLTFTYSAGTGGHYLHGVKVTY